jgi:excisionase family DNA binding protein
MRFMGGGERHSPIGAETLLHVHHVAARLGVSCRTVRLWAELGELPGFKIGRGKLWRFRRDDIEEYVAHRKEPNVR